MIFAYIEDGKIKRWTHEEGGKEERKNESRKTDRKEGMKERRKEKKGRGKEETLMEKKKELLDGENKIKERRKEETKERN